MFFKKILSSLVLKEGTNFPKNLISSHQLYFLTQNAAQNCSLPTVVILQICYKYFSARLRK